VRRVLARALLIAAAAVPLGGCLTISWQDDGASATAASAATGGQSAASPPAPARVACSYAHGWDSTSASSDISGYPKEHQCEKPTQ